MNDDRVKELLREALPRTTDVDLKRDLWPRMEHRLQPLPLSISRFDWALIAAAVAWVVIFPQSLIVLLYHL